jgi:hypothetical protein
MPLSPALPSDHLPSPQRVENPAAAFLPQESRRQSLNTLKTWLAPAPKKLAGFINHWGDLAARLFFGYRGIVAEDPNSYLCVVGAMAFRSNGVC